MTTTHETTFRFHTFATLRVSRPSSWFFTRFGNPSVAYRHYKCDVAGPCDITLQVEDFAADCSGCTIVDNRYHVRRDFLCFSDHYKLARWQVVIQGMEEGRILIRAKCNPFGMLYVMPLVEFFIRHAALRAGVAFIHAFGISDGSRGWLFPGRSGIGKTVNTSYFLHHGYQVLSDNFVIIHDTTMYAFLTPMLLFSYNLTPPLQKRVTPALKRALFVRNLLYHLTGGYAKLLTPLHIDDYFPAQLPASAPFGDMIFAFAGPAFSLRKDIDRDGLAKRMSRITLFETQHAIRALQAYTLCFPHSPLAQHWQQEEAIFCRSIDAVRCHELILPQRLDAHSFDQLRKAVHSL